MSVDQHRLCVGAEQEAVKFGRQVYIYSKVHEESSETEPKSETNRSYQP